MVVQNESVVEEEENIVKDVKEEADINIPSKKQRMKGMMLKKIYKFEELFIKELLPLTPHTRSKKPWSYLMKAKKKRTFLLKKPKQNTWHSGSQIEPSKKDGYLNGVLAFTSTIGYCELKTADSFHCHLFTSDLRP